MKFQNVLYKKQFCCRSVRIYSWVAAKLDECPVSIKVTHSQRLVAESINDLNTAVSNALLAFWKRNRGRQSWNVLNTPSTYTTPEFVPNPRAITCRYKSYRQIKFWHDSLSGINSRIPGKRGDTVTRTCVSFSRFLSPSLSHARARSLPIQSCWLSLFFFIGHVTRLFIVLYTRLANFAIVARDSFTTISFVNLSPFYFSRLAF